MIKTERKQSILSSAEKLFAEKGFFSTSIADIIQDANIARGTFYIYFDSKNAIFDELIEDFIQSIDQSIYRINISDPSRDPFIQLKDNILRVANLLYNRSHLTKIILTYATGINHDLDQKINDFYKKIINLINSAIKLGIQMEIIRPCQSEIIALCILGCIKEVAHSLFTHENPSDKLNEIVDELINFSLRGLLNT